MDASERAVGYAVSIVLVALTLWPAFRDPQVDSFPHSTYAMFTRRIEDRQLRVPHVLAVHEDGRRVPLSPLLATGTFEPLQAQTLVHRAIRGGAEPSRRLCEEAAHRLAGRAGFGDVVAIELAESWFDVLRYFDTSTIPLRRRVRRECRVVR